MSPDRNEPASSSATVKQETTQPLNASHTILAIQTVTLHPTAMAPPRFNLSRVSNTFDQIQSKP